jgi:DNA-binding transcriptional MerR regulator
LRFYEREGILPEPPRRTSGYREYPPDTVELIRFIKRSQELGFSLKEVKELLSLRKVPRRASKKATTLVDAKLAEIDLKLRDLQSMREALESLRCACANNSSSPACPIIESLSGCSESEERG